jgi:hypothetical protein
VETTATSKGQRNLSNATPVNGVRKRRCTYRLRQAIDEPTLTHARSLESALRRVGTTAKVFGRLNQKSSIDAAAESDRAITERIANAFDASVTAARRLSGMHK